MLVSRKKSEPSDAEKAFMGELNVSSEKVAAYGTVIDKIKNKMKYQQVQVSRRNLSINVAKLIRN